MPRRDDVLGAGGRAHDVGALAVGEDVGGLVGRGVVGQGLEDGEAQGAAQGLVAALCPFQDGVVGAGGVGEEVVVDEARGQVAELEEGGQGAGVLADARVAIHVDYGAGLGGEEVVVCHGGGSEVDESMYLVDRGCV